MSRLHFRNTNSRGQSQRSRITLPFLVSLLVLINSTIITLNANTQGNQTQETPLPIDSNLLESLEQNPQKEAPVTLLRTTEDVPLSPFNPWSSGDSDSTYSVAWGDVDGDGDLDLATGNFRQGNKVYLNENGILQTNVDNIWSSDDSDDTFSVAWGDVDGDGDLDLAAGNRNGANKVYLNEGGVLQTIAVWSSGDSDSTYGVAWGDVDGDGDLDLAAGNRNGANKVYLNEEGILQTADDNPWDSSDNDNTSSVAWGDVDGDGDLDLAAGNSGPYDSGCGCYLGGPNKVYLNEDGILQTTDDNPWDSNDNDNTSSVAWGDVDGDGDLDLAAGNSFGPNKVYLNEGGILQMADDNPWDSNDNDNTSSVAWGDVDGDGDLDLAAGNRFETNKVYLNEGGVLQTGVDNTWNSGDSDATQGMAWGDVDGDGDLDLAASNSSQGNEVYLNRGGSLQTDADNPWNSSDSDGTITVAWGDVDGDGDLDLAVGNSLLYSSDCSCYVGYGANKVYLNEGGVLQTDADNPWNSGDSDNSYSIAWGDVDGDGDLDLAVGNMPTYDFSCSCYLGDGANKVYLNEEGSLQTDADNPWNSGDSDLTRSIAWGDVDGDGDLDLAVANFRSSNKVYLNEGGTLQTDANSLWNSGDNDDTTSVAWGDVDGDGDLDLAAGNGGQYDSECGCYLGTPNKVYLNEGGVLQEDASWSSGDSDDTNGVAWGDVDGDGDLDLAAGNFRGPNKVYLNEGGVLQEDASWSSGDSDGTSSVAWGDVDGDGDLDLAVGNYTQGYSKVYLNWRGSLQTAADNPWASGDNDRNISVAWGDVDGDGDLDLAAGNISGANKVFLNGKGTHDLPITAPFLIVSRPITPSITSFYVPSQTITRSIVPISYHLFDYEGVQWGKSKRNIR